MRATILQRGVFAVRKENSPLLNERGERVCLLHLTSLGLSKLLVLHMCVYRRNSKVLMGN